MDFIASGMHANLSYRKAFFHQPVTLNNIFVLTLQVNLYYLTIEFSPLWSDFGFTNWYIFTVSSKAIIFLIIPTWFPVVGQIDKVFIVVQRQRHLVSVKCPRTEFHNTSLLIKWEVRYIYCTWALHTWEIQQNRFSKVFIQRDNVINFYCIIYLVNCRWYPKYFTVWIYQNIWFVSHFIIAISTIYSSSQKNNCLEEHAPKLL